MPNTMKAVRIHGYGDSSVLVYEDAPLPQIGPDEVLIKITACAINPIDWKVRQGHGKERMPITFPFILGWDVSGTIAAIGSLVSHYNPGDKVFTRPNSSRNGGYAEYIAVRASEITAAPANISLPHLAGIPLAGQTAWAGLFEQGKLRRDQSVLIHGGSGGVGTFALQFAHHMGAHVITTTSAKNKDLVLSLGADEVIDYQAEDFSKKLKDIDLVFDTIGGDTQKRSWGIIKKGGTLVSTVGADEKAAAEYGITSKSFMVDSNGARLQQIAALADQGKLKVIVEKEFPLSEARAAHDLSEKGRAAGKIILLM
ncbi:MAG: NADP-dependent oxidoreductase [Flavipsychrobacter sp.]|nr:NADP-dependent oxidoreductase [Flavipsychrobacter sp.]